MGLGWSIEEATIEEAMLPQLLLGLGLAGWGWSVGVCAGGFGVGGLRGSVVGCAFWVWGWWVGVGWAWFVLDGLGLVGRGECWQVWNWLVGVGPIAIVFASFVQAGLELAGRVCAVGFGVCAFELVGSVLGGNGL